MVPLVERKRKLQSLQQHDVSPDLDPGPDRPGVGSTSELADQLLEAAADDVPEINRASAVGEAPAYSRQEVKRLLAKGLFDQASERCTQLLSALPPLAETRSMSADKRMRSSPGDPNEAAFLLISRSIARERLGELDASLKDAKAAIRVDQHNPRCYLRAAFALVATGHSQNALACLVKARALLPLSPTSRPGRSTLAASIDRLEARIRPATLTTLPLEVFQNILSYLSFAELIKTLNVSKQWRASALSHPPLWRRLDDLHLAFRNTSKRLHHLQHQSATEHRISKQLARCCELSRNTMTSLRLDTQLLSDRHTRQTVQTIAGTAATLRELDISGPSLNLILSGILSRSPNLKVLSLHPSRSGPSYIQITEEEAERVARIRLDCLRISSQQLGVAREFPDMLSRLKSLEIQLDVKLQHARPGLHHIILETLDVVLSTLIQCRKTIERISLPWPFDPWPGVSSTNRPRLEQDAEWVFDKLVYLEEWQPLLTRTSTTGRRFAFPALRQALVGFESVEDEILFYQTSPNLESLSYDASLFQCDLRAPSGQIALLPHLKKLWIVDTLNTRYSVPESWQALMPYRNPVDGTLTVACPELEEIYFKSAPAELTARELTDMVLTRLYLSKGFGLEEALAKARPSREPAPTSVTSSPFTRGSKPQPANSDAAKVSSEETTEPTAGQDRSGRASSGDGSRPPCCAIKRLDLFRCRGIDEETARFLGTVVEKFTFNAYG